MKNLSFPGETISNLIDGGWKYRKIDHENNTIEYIGKPNVVGKTNQYLKVTMKITHLEVCTIFVPEVPVDERNVFGTCTWEKMCSSKTSDARCTDTSDEKCKFCDGERNDR